MPAFPREEIEAMVEHWLDALGLGKISVGPPYFDTVFGLLMAPLVLFMGIGPLTRWKHSPTTWPKTSRRWRPFRSE